MITASRPVHAGDTTGATLTVHLPESIVRANREGSSWVARVSATQAARLRSKGWAVAIQATTSRVASTMALAPSTPTTFQVLSGTVAALEAELDQGLHDGHLDALRAAEESGKGRSTALRAIDARAEDVNP